MGVGGGARMRDNLCTYVCGGGGGCWRVCGVKVTDFKSVLWPLTGATEAQYERAEQRGQQWPRPINIPAAFMSRLDPPLHSHLIKVTNISSCKP